MRFGPKTAAVLAGPTPAEASEKLQAMLADYNDAPMAEVAVILSGAMALQHVHHSNHWQTRGSDYYGDHLLFQRLYEEMTDEIDSLGERAVGLGGYQLVQPMLVAGHALQIIQCMYSGVDPFPGPEMLAAIGQRAEACFSTLVSEAYKSLDSKGGLTLGLDNMLQGVVDLHESHLYLLGQRVDETPIEKGDSLAQRVAARYKTQ